MIKLYVFVFVMMSVKIIFLGGVVLYFILVCIINSILFLLFYFWFCFDKIFRKIIFLFFELELIFDILLIDVIRNYLILLKFDVMF